MFPLLSGTCALHSDASPLFFFPSCVCEWVGILQIALFLSFRYSSVLLLL